MRKLLTALIAVSCAHAMPVAAQVAGVRSFTGSCAVGQPVVVQLDVEVGAQIPNGVIVVEKLPAGWLLSSAMPAASSFNTITGEARWVFFGGSVNDDDLDIQYTASAGDPASGVISGDLRYNDSEGQPQAVTIGGAGTCEHAPSCVGDCDGDGTVTVDEILQLIVVLLGGVSGTPCPAADADGSGSITVDEIVTAVNNLLNGCP